MDTVMRGNDVAQASYLPMDTITRCSLFLELKQSRRSLLHANGHCDAWFLMFADETKWN